MGDESGLQRQRQRPFDLRLGPGGLNAGRGFNVAVIDRSSGNLLFPVRSFDTWLTRTTGEKLREMVALLQTVPDGALVMIAMADDAGLNADNSCSALPYAWVQEGYQALEALGSTTIRQYCFRNSWAMTAVKGQGVALDEQRASGAEVVARATVSLP